MAEQVSLVRAFYGLLMFCAKLVQLLISMSHATYFAIVTQVKTSCSKT